jgi:hypothetical protein
MEEKALCNRVNSHGYGNNDEDAGNQMDKRETKSLTFHMQVESLPVLD